MSSAVPVLSHVDEYLDIGREGGASDIHLAVECPPMWRRYGKLEVLWTNGEILRAADTEHLLLGFLSGLQKEHLFAKGDIDFAYANANGRFRASVVRQRRGYDLAFRIIHKDLRTMGDLGLPAQLKRLTQYHNGLVLVTGPVGSGKSTTLAALIEEINNSRRDHIVTLEDPIEAIIESKGCHVTQREIHTHTQSFAAALRSALREDPDVIMIGEMRDLETISLAITASETGHLVLGTVHTTSAARTLDRLLDVFPADQREQIRMMVSESLRGVVSQRLLTRSDGRGRVLALEILMNSPAVANIIREGKTFMLPGVMQTGKRHGMKMMDDSIAELFRAGLIDAEEAVAGAEQKQMMRQSCAVGRGAVPRMTAQGR